jgi:hypothetical protein
MPRSAIDPTPVRRMICDPSFAGLSLNHAGDKTMQSLAEIANDYITMMAAGEILAAAEKYWASDIVALEPNQTEKSDPVIAIGKPAALARLANWLEANAISELLIDGPFITGDQFALFIDMEITRHATGIRQPFSEIATYTVREGQIVEERFFYG